MDMNRFLHHRLTNAKLMEFLEFRYEGRICNVVEEEVFNKFKLTKTERVPNIMFDDGWEWIPNLAARRQLSEAWGPETDGWVGRRMAIFLRSVDRTEKKSGRLVEALEKNVEPLPDEETGYESAV